MCIRRGFGFGRTPCYPEGMCGNPPTHVTRGAPRDADIRPAGMVSGGRRARTGSAALAVAAGMWLASGAAVAGDFYLRGGIGLDRPGNTAFTDVDCSTTAPAALYGCGTGGDGARLRSRGSFGPVPAFEFGLGHAGATPARFEFLVEYRPRLAFEGRANFLAPERRQEVRAELSSVSGMLAGFVDLAGSGLWGPGSLAPFVGAGIGAAHIRIGKTTMTFPATTTIVPGASRTGLAWMATAGFAVALNERVSIDLAWRYTDLGEVRTGRGAGRVVWRNGRREPLPLELAPTKARLAAHGVRLSLRYAF